MHTSLIRFEVLHEQEIEPQDVIDAVRTISPIGKIEIDVPCPGKGPDHFLAWAREELEEAIAADTEEEKKRKLYNSVVYSKCAVECLVDWYLVGKLLTLTLPQYAGAALKLKALNSNGGCKLNCVSAHSCSIFLNPTWRTQLWLSRKNSSTNCSSRSITPKTSSAKTAS